MPRPTTKAELMQAANGQFEKMWEFIDSMGNDGKDAVFAFGDDSKHKEAHWKRDKNLRDVLVHLYEWHRLLLDWVAANTSGNAKPFLPERYNWKTYGDMNVAFWEKHQSTSYEDAKEMILASHKKVLEMIDQFSDAALFEKAYFPWTGTTSLGSYCISATSSHYDWAIKKIKRYIKTVQAAKA